MTRMLLALCAAVLATGCAAAGAGRGGTVPRAGAFHFDAVRVEGREHRFALWVPEGYDPARAWPTIVFLHGRGECGDDGRAPTRIGLGPALEKSPSLWPFLVVFPQKPEPDELWADRDAIVLAALGAVRATHAVDPTRIYLTGLSQGGAGTWMIGGAHSRLFAALAPVCGWGDPERLAAPLRDVPVWAFHGALDDLVPPRGTVALVEAIRAAGGRPELTIFPEANHNSWDPAYAGSSLPRWLLRQRRP